MTVPLPEEIPEGIRRWGVALDDTQEIPVVTGAIPHAHRRAHMTVERPRGAPMFNLPVPPVRYVPVIRRGGFTVEPPSHLPSPVLEAAHSKWARSRPNLDLWGVPHRYEYAFALAVGVFVGVAAHIAWAAQSVTVVLP